MTAKDNTRVEAAMNYLHSYGQLTVLSDALW